MASMEPLVKAWALCYFELGEAFGGEFPPEDLWRRPHPNLLSVGEVAGHIAYNEARNVAGPGWGSKANDDEIPVKSPLINKRFSYYENSIQDPVILELSPSEVLSELQRVHEESKAAFLAGGHDGDEKSFGSEASWSYVLQYVIFHTAYHTGQIYSVRHVLGHKTVDN